MCCACGRGLRGRGAAEDGDLARPESPSRCTLPITAFLVMPPSSAAIWLAERPSAHSFFSVSTRSSVQFMPQVPWPPSCNDARTESISVPGQPPGWPDAYSRYRFTLNSVRRREMSYPLIETLQYGGSRAQESDRRASTCSARLSCTHPHLSAAL